MVLTFLNHIFFLYSQNTYTKFASFTSLPYENFHQNRCGFTTITQLQKVETRLTRCCFWGAENTHLALTFVIQRCVIQDPNNGCGYLILRIMQIAFQKSIFQNNFFHIFNIFRHGDLSRRPGAGVVFNGFVNYRFIRTMIPINSTHFFLKWFEPFFLAWLGSS